MSQSLAPISLNIAFPAVYDFSDLPPEIYATLEAVLVCAFVHKHPLSLGSTLHFITSQVSLDLLKSWSDYSDDAASLFDLGVALAQHPSLKKLESLSHSKSSRAHFRRELDKYYLIALLSERLPLPESDPLNWMHQLRLWLFIQALVRSRRGVFLDENLLELARSMRNACDRDRGWLDFYFRLQPARIGASFAEFNNQIWSLSNRALNTSEFSDKEERTLKAALAVCASIDKPIETGDAARLPQLKYPTEGKNPPSSLKLIDIEGLGVFEAGEDQDGNTGYLRKVQDEKATPAQRRLSVDTVVMTTREAVLHLPWRWGCPNPSELQHLDDWLSAHLDPFPTDFLAALTVAYVWIGYSTGRSAARVLDMEIGNTTGEEWRLDVKSAVLHRIPPMRRPGWLPDDSSANWVMPAAQKIELKLPESMAFLLRTSHKQTPRAKILADYWPTKGELTATQAIDRALAAASTRLTSSMLAEALPQRIFNETKDSVLARLIASHPQSSLGGAASYAQWSLETVTRLLSGESSPSTSVEAIGLGSRLAVIDRQIQGKLRQVIRRVMQCRNGDPIAFHNAYSAYSLLALEAATGVRPTTSLFQSGAYFDFDEHFVYVDDKHNDALDRGGRVIPLPVEVSAFLRKRYLPHLEAIASLLQQGNTALADEIAWMARQQPTGRLPFFFFLREDGSAWQEITPSGIVDTLELDWPLPENLFRHRLANRLRSLSLDPEIIDGLLGHGEWGHGTWCDSSFRSWLEDAKTCRPKLSTIFRTLRFHPLRGLGPNAKPVAQIRASSALGPAVFGEKARKEQRFSRIKKAINQADAVIAEACRGCNLGELKTEELDKLFERLATNGRGLPDPMGGIRLAHLMRKIEQTEASNGMLLRPKKQYRIVHDAPSLFTADAVGAIRHRSDLRKTLASLRPENPRHRRLAATIALAIDCRISDMRLLADVGANRNYRLVRFEKRLYLEHREFSERLETPYRRFRLTGLAVPWMGSLPPDKGWQRDDSLPDGLQSIYENLNLPREKAKFHDLIKALSHLADQVNALTLPGVLCAVMSGRIQTRSLGWRDWIRLKTGRRVKLPDDDGGPHSTENSVDPDSSPYRIPEGTSAEAEVSRKAASKFFKDLRKKIWASLRNVDRKANPRRALLMEMHALIKQAPDLKVPASAILLGAWIHEMAQPVGRRTREPSTLLRYLTALSYRFAFELADVDLLNADDEEITDAYTRLLSSNNKRPTKYVVERLVMFHAWLRRSYGVEDPEWDELPVSFSIDAVAPGFFTQKDYLDAFEVLDSHASLNDEDRLAAKMLLCLGYRFGLRRREALGLAREDWGMDAGGIIVTVEPNSWRGLKSPASRRQVPQVFTLTPQEEKVVSDMLGRYTARHGDNNTHLLLPCSSWVGLSAIVISVLKEVTGNPLATFHHARHSAANLVALHALGAQPEQWRDLGNDNGDIESCLLGKKGTSRRHAWAISRFMGHAGPKTTFKSYLHFLLDWAGDLICFGEDVVEDQGAKVYILDDLPSQPEVPPKPNQHVPPAASISKIVQAFRLHARNLSPEKIKETLNITDQMMERIQYTLKEGESKTRVRELVEGLQESSWERLVAWSRENDFTCKDQEVPFLSSGDLVKMVGATSQLVAWKREHFVMLRWALEKLCIQPSEYKIYGSANVHQGTLDLASELGFVITPRPHFEPRPPSKKSAKKAGRLKPMKRAGQPRKSKFQIDTVTDGPFHEQISSRIAFVFEENATQHIRNRNQFVVMILASALAVMSV